MHTDKIAQFIVDLMHDHVAHCDSEIPHIACEDGGADIEHAEATGSNLEIVLQSGESYRVTVTRSHHRGPRP